MLSKKTLKLILESFGLNPNTNAKPFGSGLINSTFLLENEQKYILQKINTEVFKRPEIIASNIRNCAAYFDKHHPEYHFITPILTKTGAEYLINEGAYWRLTPFVANSFSFDQLTKPNQAYEAAKAVGQFAKACDGIDTKNFGETIPRFHDLSFRYEQFLDALHKGNQVRLRDQHSTAERIKALSHICDTFEEIKSSPSIPIRIQHHDTKINNILFDKTSQTSICLCDLDTIMPGYFISDLGDMIRTYLSSANEEEKDLDKVKARPDFYEALIAGYLSEMQDILTPEETKYLHYSGEFLIYMQALRFFTDYLNNDSYYTTSYPEHNLNRTLNQLQLLDSYTQLKK